VVHRGADKVYMDDGSFLGHRKAELYPTDAVRSVGAAEFIFAPPDSNKYLPEGYVENTLGGLPELLRRRYMDGEWLFTSGLSYFETDAMLHYADMIAPTLRRFDFLPIPGGGKAEIREHGEGKIRVFAEPVEGHSYAIGADVATGYGRDYSAAYVVDLGSMEFVAEFHGKLDADLYAAQLHFLGRHYQSALIAIESAGGFGDPVVIALRDGKGGRPAYPNLYRHQLDLQVDLPVTKRYGFPMSSRTRPQVLTQLAKAVREHDLPFVTEGLLNEMTTFVYMESGTSPRAQEGCNDDRVMSAAIALEMYRRKGHHPDREARLADRRGRKPKRERKAAFPWLRA
jgi:hypothetical protein